MVIAMGVAFIMFVFFVGYGLGLHNRKYPLNNDNELRALAYFLRKEQWRHRADIVRADIDLKKLEALGVNTTFPKRSFDAWIEPRRRKPCE